MEVRRWQRAEAELASNHVREWPLYEPVRGLVARFTTESYVTLPRYVAGRWFRTRIPDGGPQAQVLVSDEPLGDGQVLFDSMTETGERPPYLSWISPSPDARILALGLCTDGSERNRIHLIDVATTKALTDPPPQLLMDNWTGGVHWLPDSSGFFFCALTGASADFTQEMYLHRRIPMPTTAQLDIAWTRAKDWRMVTVSRDGQYAVAVDRAKSPIPVAVAALRDSPLKWRPFITSIERTVAGHLLGDRYIAVTDVGAPRGRLVGIPLNAEDPNDPECWQDLVDESEAVLRTVTPVGHLLYLTEFVDTYARVRIADHDGNERGAVPLPGRGAIVSDLPSPIMNLVPKGHPEKFLFGFSSLTVSPGIYCHTPNQPHIETLQEPKVRVANAVVEERRAESADGTRIPYHIVRRADVSPSEPQPTLIYAYGGFNIPLVPQFPGPMSAFVAAGGLFVHAHLRGGGEFGLEWWQGGRMGNKQNGYDDLYAVAEDLISAQRCTPQLLAVTGVSNGGLMAAVALTQRPDLWAVAIPRVAITDLIGACRDPYGRMGVMMEYANVDDPAEVQRLATFSPYHLVRDGVSYPGILIDSGAADPRCPAWHARKFAARLQSATSGDAPILLHVWEDVGHGGATGNDVALAQQTEWLAFALRHLGVKVLP